jgi:hypothetical protein
MPGTKQPLSKLEMVNREIRASLVVISHLEARQSRLIKEQAE